MWYWLCSLFGLCKRHDAYGNIIVKGICNRYGYNKYCWEAFEDDMTAMEYESFWYRQRPLRNDKHASVSKIETLLHLRCGDVPFDKYTPYDMACPENISSVLATLGRHEVQRDVHVMVGGHGSHQHECDILFREYIEALRCLNSKINFVPLQRDNIDSDFDTLQAATNVISIVPSSYVFVSQLGKFDNYKMPQFGRFPNVSWTFEATPCDPYELAYHRRKCD